MNLRIHVHKYSYEYVYDLLPGKLRPANMAPLLRTYELQSIIYILANYLFASTQTVLVLT